MGILSPKGEEDITIVRYGSSIKKSLLTFPSSLRGEGVRRTGEGLFLIVNRLWCSS